MTHRKGWDNGMSFERYRELETNQSLKLSEEEIAEGWHWCYEWDGMLIHPSWPEAGCCGCFDDK